LNCFPAGRRLAASPDTGTDFTQSSAAVTANTANDTTIIAFIFILAIPFSE
jgi:hypothetical protein